MRNNFLFVSVYTFLNFCESAGEYTESLTWSKTFSYEAILKIPGAGILLPYKVWVDGTTGNTRVDYYNGLDKFYRLRMYGSNTTFTFFKVHPEIDESHIGRKEVCNRLLGSDLAMVYSLNTYLPTHTFTFEGYDFISDVKCQKWVSRTNVKMLGYDVLFTSTVWVVQEEFGDRVLAKPLRYDYNATVGDVTLDEFNHEYIDFSFNPVDNVIFGIPNGMSCMDIEVTEGHEPIDYLQEYIAPLIGFAKMSKAFESFKLKHNKQYISGAEHLKRMNTFANNLRYINVENKRHNTYTLAVNHLADLTEEEMKIFYGTIKDHDSFSPESETTSPQDELNETDIYYDIFDWRYYNAVTPVKEQTSMCGSCYAFATAAVVESSLYIQNGFRKLREVSEQSIIDCTWGVNNVGCSGGNYIPSLKWIKSKGVPYKQEYGPYLAMEGLCHHSNMSKLGFINTFRLLPNDVITLKKFLRKKGPLLAAVGSSKSFMFYSGGVYNDELCKNNTVSRLHGITIVGYGISEGKPYWIIKNSFGTTWGEGGYMKIAIEGNTCGITNTVLGVEANMKHGDSG